MSLLLISCATDNRRVSLLNIDSIGYIISTISELLTKDLPQTQVCPEPLNLLAIVPATAVGRSASSNTIKGAFPPNSLVIFFIVPAQFAASIFPIRVLPVKETFLIKGLVVSSWPISWRFASVVTTFKTPSGTPARLASCH